MSQQNIETDNAYVRIGVQDGLVYESRNGNYMLDITEHPRLEDIRFKIHGLLILIHQNHTRAVDGVVVDFEHGVNFRFWPSRPRGT